MAISVYFPINRITEKGKEKNSIQSVYDVYEHITLNTVYCQRQLASFFLFCLKFRKFYG